MVGQHGDVHLGEAMRHWHHGPLSCQSPSLLHLPNMQGSSLLQQRMCCRSKQNRHSPASWKGFGSASAAAAPGLLFCITAPAA